MLNVLDLGSVNGQDGIETEFHFSGHGRFPSLDLLDLLFHRIKPKQGQSQRHCDPFENSNS
ncbi:hypothetical protein K239x_27050 [Planctomycetes bacterium K23_9]|uniref:Uncharacterized protein n=1 Tax=Stieleria marina TaxID=1930275 RepID=A0A517NUE4_9BACT|nr:hypothetical protein K239x_27050 [Planctomycetes bacterium K23_9]